MYFMVFCPVSSSSDCTNNLSSFARAKIMRKGCNGRPAILEQLRKMPAESGRSRARQLSFDIDQAASPGGFNRNRLRFARELRNLRQAQLGELAGLNASAISQFESGWNGPSATTIDALARALRVPPEFFASEDSLTASMATGYFRADRKTPKPVKTSVSRWLSLLGLALHALDDQGLLPEDRVPTMPVRPGDTSTDVERLAQDVRNALEVSNGPIPDAIALVESYGVLVAQVLLPVESMDSFSVRCLPRSVIALGSGRRHSGRNRFDVCHELGHLVMHQNAVAPHGILEQQADQFASSFLMPGTEIEDELPPQVDIHEYAELAEKWGVSTEALIYRAHMLGLVTKESYLRARTFLRRSWRSNDPNRDERPSVAHQVAARADEPGAARAVALQLRILEEDVTRLVHRSQVGDIEVFDLLLAT